MQTSLLLQSDSNMSLLPSSGQLFQTYRRFEGSQWLHESDSKILASCKQNLQFPRSWSLPNSQSKGLQGVPVLQFQRRCSGRVFSSRNDSGKIMSLERLVRRTVRAEQKEKEQNDEQPKPASIVQTNSQSNVWKDNAQKLQMAAQIFTAMMTWVLLFFMASMWDGDSQNSRSSGKRKGPRK